ncbi:FAD binding domain-containing protein [Spongiimicrobium sp. 2-473A-2-J]|uniref:FAD binding domain-containing protein n=1 Tax=Eudoraea algarum TaxID=3417568 RepID=UPI003D35B7F6
MIKFILNNELVQTKLNPGMTLLDFIREQKQLKGTKIGCREGDCGACTVLVGEENQSRMRYESITSCISPLGNANGKHIVTIEGVNLIDTLNVAQQAMADHFATQCGFCTPGFVVSMTGYAINKNKTRQSTCNDAISGNICRCTGYKSIEKAGLELEKQLMDTQGSEDFEDLAEKGFIPTYFKEIQNRLKELTLLKPRTNGAVVANGTDLYVHHADRLTEEAVHLIAADRSMRHISFSDNRCTLGSNTTVTDILEHRRLREIIPNLRQHLKLVSSEPIRNMGTLGGNFVNASPIGDMTIFFLALNSTLTLQDKKGGKRTLAFNEFYQDYKKFDLKADELVLELSFPVPSPKAQFNFEKVSKRTHLDIASVNSALLIEVEGDSIQEVHASMGGVAPIPKYLYKTVEFLKGKALDPINILKAEQVLQKEISPISDVRGSEQYKRLLGRQLFFAHFIKLFPSHFSLKNLSAP